MVGPGVLAGLSDDDPAGITTYSILGAKYGYRLLWVLALSTAALIVFHELGARMGVVTGKGLLALVRERYGRAAPASCSAPGGRELGTICAEFAGVAAGMELLAGVSRYVSVPLAALGVSVLVLRGLLPPRRARAARGQRGLRRLHRLGLPRASRLDARPRRGLVVPSMPLTREAVLVAVATLGTTLAPWGLAFIQSYAVDKRLKVEDLRYERVDVIVGAVLTGVIGLFIVVACAATLHAQGQ